MPDGTGSFDGAAVTEDAQFEMLCLVVAEAGILRILTWAEGKAPAKALKSFCREISFIPPFTLIGKFSPPLVLLELGLSSDMGTFIDASHSLVRPRTKKVRPAMLRTESTISELIVAT